MSKPPLEPTAPIAPDTIVLPIARIEVLFTAPDSDLTLYIEPVKRGPGEHPLLIPLTDEQGGRLLECINMQLRHLEEIT